MAQTELCIPPQTCTARRDPRRSYTATIGTMFHIQYRGIQIKVKKVVHTTTQELKALIGTASHNQYQSIQTKVNKVPHTTVQELKALIGKEFHNQHRGIQKRVNTAAHPHNQALNKKARGVCRGAMALWPLCGFLASQSKKISTLPRKEKHTLNRQRVPQPTPKHTNKSQHRPTSPQPKHSTKKARGVCRGAVALRPLCGFP